MSNVVGEILGVVDDMGACHSVATGNRQSPDTHFPDHRCCVWRWVSGKGLYAVTPEPEPPGLQVIRNHLEACYGIRVPEKTI